MNLLDACELIVDCPHSTAKDEGKGFPLIRTPNIGKGRLILDGVHRVCEEVYNQRNARAIPQSGDLILAREAPVGNVAVVQEGQKVCLGQRTVLIRPKETCVDSNYLVYYLLSPPMQNLLLTSANGATVSHLNMADIRKLNIELPQLNMQKKIGRLLGVIDDLIDVNNRINRNLSEQIDAFFYKLYTSKDTKKIEFGDVVERCTEKVKNDVVKVLSPISTGEIVLSEEYFTKQVYSKDIGKYIKVAPYEYCYNPARANIGSIGMNDFDFVGCVSPVYVVFKTQEKLKYYMSRCFKTEQFKKEVITRSSGSVRQALKYDDLIQIEFRMPSDSMLDEFNCFYTTTIPEIKKLKNENMRLSNIRDTLLPKLMSGELDVSELDI